MAENLLNTALHQKHIALGATNVSFCGWDMPVQYDSIIKEHGYCRQEAALFDTSHMGEFFFEGDVRSSGINEATTVNIDILAVGKCKYGFLLNESGGVIDDLIIYRLAENKLMIIVNASGIENDYKTIASRLNSGSLKDNSLEFSKIDIQGPKSKEILQSYFNDINLDDMGFFSFKETKIFDEYCLLSRTGYTGEIGFEIYVYNDMANKVWDALVKDGAKPAGLGARDALRLEMGYSLYGNDLTEDISPLEANLAMFVNLKRDFIGRNALLKQKEEGVKRLLIPFKTSSRRSARKDFVVMQNNEKIGFVTSGGFSPILGVGVGLAMVDVAKFDENKEFELSDERSSIKASKATLPFIKKG